MFTVPVNLSNRHIHLTAADVATLFGPNYSLTLKLELLQPGAFAAEELVSISGPTGTIERIRVVGPTRSMTQCEILTGDTYKLGFTPGAVPVRLSGDISNSAAFTVTGPAGSIEKSEGLIIAQRHIHISPEEATVNSLMNAQLVTLQCDTPNRRTDLHDVVVRFQSGAALECHIDIEEGNAVGIGNGYELVISTD